MDPKLALHKLLLTDISDHLGNSGPEYDNFIEHMKGYVPPGKLASKKNLLDKLSALASLGHLKPGEYDVLKKIATDSRNMDVLEIVEKAEEKIRSHQDKTQGLGSSRNSTATRTSVQESTIDNPGPPKRPREELDRPDPLYSTDCKNRGFYDNKDKEGLLLILNSTENRKGTEKDVDQLKGFFKDVLRFTVFDPRENEDDDLTTQTLDEVLGEVRQKLNGHLGKCYYCFACVILSHGNEKGIKTKDGMKSIEDIRKFFNNKNVPNFTGRPKVFFVQACRGLEEQGSETVDEADDEVEPEVDESDELIRVPSDADTLIAFATTPGYKSFRRLSVGSWFITECMRVFNEFYKEDHLEDMLITVRERVVTWQKQNGAKQMPCVWSTLTKRLQFSS